MPYRPNINDTLVIDGATYQVAEHPAAPGIPYGQEGRQAVVYQILSEGGERQALKVFKARYRVPGLVALTERLEIFAGMPGLQVCHRIVLSARRHSDVLRQHPDLTYAIVMPWVAGPTWMEVVLEQRGLMPLQSLSLARALAETLAMMEERGLAHCDLSGPNVLLPALLQTTQSGAAFPVDLVDVEQLYGPGLERPSALPGGSAGYAHKSAPTGLWSADADRFAGAVLLAEMLSWCDRDVRGLAYGESYFDPDEMQVSSQRYDRMRQLLHERWGDAVARLFEQAWVSETLADCPTFGEWLVTLPQAVPASDYDREIPAPDDDERKPDKADTTVRAMLELAQDLRASGNHTGARAAYQRALSLIAPEGGLAQEIALLIQDLEATSRSAPTEPAPAVTVAIAPQIDLDAPAQVSYMAPQQRFRRWVLAGVAVLIVLGIVGLSMGARAANPQEQGMAAIAPTATLSVQILATGSAEVRNTALAREQATAGAKATAIRMAAASTATAAAQATTQADSTATAMARASASAVAETQAAMIREAQTATAQAQAVALEQAQTATAQAQATQAALNLAKARRIAAAATQTAIAKAREVARPTETPAPPPTETPAPPPTEAPAPPPPIPDQGRSAVFEVKANRPFRHVGVDAQAGEIVTITYVSGKWAHCAECPDVGAEGYDNRSEEDEKFLKNCPYGALVGKFHDKEVLCITSSVTLQMKRSGSLELRTNDNVLDDNRGSIMVQVTVR
jgi:hypothetical protein